MLPERIALRIVIIATGCWMWQQSRTCNGYGQVHFPLDGKRNWSAHRLVYRLLVGLPLPQQLHHTCPNKLCVNPAHLTPMTLREHQRIHHMKDKCAYGHALTPDSVYIRKNGGRQCRACKARVERERQARKGEAWRKEQGRRNSERRRARAGACACGTPLGSPGSTRCRECARKDRWAARIE